MLFRYLRLMACFIVMLGAACVQAQTARISGKVFDPTGAVVPKAFIHVTNQETKMQLEATVDDNGNYTVPYLTAASYRVLVHVEGFSDYETCVTLGMGQALDVDIQLSLPSARREEVRVEGSSTTQVETISSDVVGTITGTQVPAIGLNGRNFTQLTTLVAGVSNQTGQDEARVGAGVGGSVSFSVNGGRTEYNSFQVDGSETLNVGMHKDKTSLIVTPSIDAIQEIKVVTSNYSAMYPSVGSGTTIITTKSGTDRFHGSLYEFFRNEFMNAKGYFDVGNRAPLYRRNDFGGTIGGPVDIPHVYNGKGKTFFFFSEEARLETDPYAYRQAVPSLAERQGDFSDVCPILVPGGSSLVSFRRAQYPDCPADSANIALPGLVGGFPNNTLTTLNRNALLILGTGMVPLPNATTGCNSTVGSCYNGEVSLPTYWREELFRIDHAFTDTLRINFHYIHDAWNTTTPVPQFAFVQNSFPTIQNSFYGPGISLVGRMTKTLSSTLLNELVLSYTNEKITLTDIPAANVTLQGVNLLGAPGVGMTTIFDNGSGGKIPGIVIAGNNQAYGGKGFSVDPAYLPWEHTNPLYSVSDNLTKIYGSHNIQLGVYVLNFQRNQTNGSIGAATGDTQGILTFSNDTGGNTTGNSFADFLSGQSIASFQQDSAQGRYRQRYWVVEPYLQDDFKVNSRLTLNLGLRVSLFGNFHEANNQAYNWVLSAYNAAEGTSLTVGSQGQLINRATGQNLEMNPNNPVPSLDPRLLNGIVHCGVNGVPSGCMTSRVLNPAPRIGFAWSPFGTRTAIRGGYGMFFEHGTADEANTGSLEGAAPLVLDMTQSNPTGWSSIGVAPDGNSLVYPLNVTSIPTKTVWPYVQQWSLSVERELPQQMLAGIAYVGSKGTNLPAQLQINQLRPLPASDNPYGPHQPLLVSGFNPITVGNPTAYPNGGDCNGILPNGTVIPPVLPGSSTPNPTFINLQVACYGVGQDTINPNAFRELAPGFGQIYSLQNVANSSYNSLQVSFRRAKAPMVLGVAYTYSHSIDDASDRSDASSVNSLDLPSSRASSSFDQRHLLNVSYIYDLSLLAWRDRFLKLTGCSQKDVENENPDCPTASVLPRAPSRLAESLLNGWQLSGVTIFQSGTPFTVINFGSPDGIGTLDNAGVANGSGAGSYPDLCGDAHGAIPFGGDNSSSFGPLLLNPGAFCAPRGLTFGDAGRNVLRNPRRFNTDLAFLKHFTMREGSSAELRFEFFNVFNNRQFRIFDPTLGNQANNTLSCYGSLGTGYSGAGGDGANCLTGSAFLHPVSAHRPRTTQLAFKWTF